MAGVMFAHTDGGNRPAMARFVARHRLSTTRRLRQLAVCAVSAAAVTLPVGVLGAPRRRQLRLPRTY